MDLRTCIDLIVIAVVVNTAIFAWKQDNRRRRDQATIAGFQRAFASPPPQLPGLSIGSTVLSASPGAGVGGDIVDAFELDSRFAMILVADVSGKGIEAAAHTAFIKYTIRALALDSDGDPAVVLAKFNAMYPRTIKDTEAFVVLILGIADSQTGEVRYASAGHEPAFIRRRGGEVKLLAPTGPIVGVSPFSAYRTDAVTLNPGDVLVWTTDGMTESRDRRHRLLGVDGLAAWIAAAPHDVAGLADSLVASLRARSQGDRQDDVAVLALAYDPASSVIGRRTIPAYRYDALLRELRDRRPGRP